MTRQEVDEVKMRLGGDVATVDILLQIVRADKSKLVHALALNMTKAKCLYEFFADRGRLPSGFYLYIEENIPAYKHLDFVIIHLSYGYCREDGSGLEKTYPLVRTAKGKFDLIDFKEYPTYRYSPNEFHFNTLSNSFTSDKLEGDL